MNVHLLENYLTKYASSTIISRAEEYSPTLVEYKANRAEFQCVNKEGITYKIYIYEINDMVTSSCSCPYDLGGICKHTVASLNTLIAYLNHGNIVFTKTSKSIEKEASGPGIIQLHKHQLDLHEIKSLFNFDKYYIYGEDFKVFSQTKV